MHCLFSRPSIVSIVLTVAVSGCSDNEPKLLDSSSTQDPSNSSTTTSCLEPLVEQPRFVALDGGSGHTIAMTDHGELFAWGNNDYGQLGLGHTNSKLEPTKIAALQDKKVVAISAGYNFSTAITDHGELFTWGRNNTGQLGHGNTDEYLSPTQVAALEDFTLVAVAAAGTHRLVITDHGELFAWGGNDDGQLGVGDTNRRNTPIKVSALEDKEIVAISALSSRSMAITSDGELYIWGENDSGELGLGHSNPQLEPALVTSLAQFHIKSIAVGNSFNVALTDHGELFSWGKNEQGELGHDNTLPYLAPTKITALDHQKIVAISTGRAHVVALTDHGELFTWGSNFHGQLGLGHSNQQTVPTLIAELVNEPIDIISSGMYHSMAVTEGGELLAWGANDDGQLGLGTTDSYFTPRPVFSKREESDDGC